jgi:hypothetical protein
VGARSGEMSPPPRVVGGEKRGQLKWHFSRSQFLLDEEAIARLQEEVCPPGLYTSMLSVPIAHAGVEFRGVCTTRVCRRGRDESGGGNASVRPTAQLLPCQTVAEPAQGTDKKGRQIVQRARAPHVHTPGWWGVLLLIISRFPTSSAELCAQLQTHQTHHTLCSQHADARGSHRRHRRFVTCPPEHRTTHTRSSAVAGRTVCIVTCTRVPPWFFCGSVGGQGGMLGWSAHNEC